MDQPMNSIYGPCEVYLPTILQTFIEDMEEVAANYKKETSLKLYEHLHARIKTEKSMREKCQRKGLPQTSQSALKEIRDAIGVRIITGFTDDIYRIVEYIRQMPSIHIFKEKDYIRQVKPNGYRSYHLILEVATPYPDCLGNDQGTYFIEIQLRTIAMDSWASLEHQMKYKHEIAGDVSLITAELKRCADELASTDISMQTIRDMIRGTIPRDVVAVREDGQ